MSDLVTQWLAVDPDPASRAVIESLHAAGDPSLDKMLAPRIAFGTAGLRLSMAPGFAHINAVTVLQTSQGLCKYLLTEFSEPRIVIGFDHRHNSRQFAEITASAAITAGIKVYFLSDDAGGPVHTPLVPFAVDHYRASAGVMVTASHNPAADNGYKVYWANGCQIIPPRDAEIAASIDQNLDPWPGVWAARDKMSSARKAGTLVDVKNKITDLYVEAVKDKLVRSSVDFPFVYTPMHGVGDEIFARIMPLLNLSYSVVPEQRKPDPDFPTVKFPNPEEAGALDLAIDLARTKDVRLVVATDPDADRFSVAVATDSGWRQLTGNEIGFLFGLYVIETATDLPNTYLVNSTVSSQILNAMAQKDGFHFQDTLTGFKWIGNKAIDLKKEGYSVPFAYEEAIGFMFDVVNDKDGISAAVVFLQLYQKWFAKGDISPIEKLKQAYDFYGWHKEANGYYKLTDTTVMPKIFEHIRTVNGPGKSTSIGDFSISEWRDLTLGYDSSTLDKKPVLPCDPTSQMITAKVTLAEGTARFTCRGSGTEPKLKVYIEGIGENEEEALKLANKCWDTLEEYWFKQWGIEPIRTT